jgi:hypothetical protein
MEFTRRREKRQHRRVNVEAFWDNDKSIDDV